MIRPFIFLLTFMTPIYAFAHGEVKHTEEATLSGSKTEPGKVVLAFHDALKQQDAKAARALLADDVIIFEGGKAERSADEYASHHMLSDMKYLSKVSSELVEHSVIQQDLSATSLIVSENKNDKGKAYTLMETIVLTKGSGEWKISHIHWSTGK